MKKIALRNVSGTWVYYITSFTYLEVAELVKIASELHRSSALSGIIQRALTDNTTSIKEYILNQKDHFFNSLVLAVYDGDPQWSEIDFYYGDSENYKAGILEFTGNEKIFPVDGQHRVEGIKQVLKTDQRDSFVKESIPVVLIGHKNTKEGIVKTRRLFSTLNRYAKPVALNEIIALDEDDIAAIVTRRLIEDFDLFKDNRVLYSKSKAIPNNEKYAFTNIITLYNSNIEIIKRFVDIKKIKISERVVTSKKLKSEFLKFRWPEEIIDSVYDFCFSYWDAFKTINSIKDFIDSKEEAPALKYRNKEGGNILFRPVALYPFVIASLQLYDHMSFADIFQSLNNMNFDIKSKLWNNILWNSVESKMITSDNREFIKSIMLYLIGLSNSKNNDTILKKYNKSFNTNIAKFDIIEECYKEFKVL